MYRYLDSEAWTVDGTLVVGMGYWGLSCVVCVRSSCEVVAVASKLDQFCLGSSDL